MRTRGVRPPWQSQTLSGTFNIGSKIIKITSGDQHEDHRARIPYPPVLLAPDYDSAACSSAQDDLIVEVRTDEGIVGVGETDTNP